MISNETAGEKTKIIVVDDNNGSGSKQIEI